MSQVSRECSHQNSVLVMCIFEGCDKVNKLACGNCFLGPVHSHSKRLFRKLTDEENKMCSYIPLLNKKKELKTLIQKKAEEEKLALLAALQDKLNANLSRLDEMIPSKIEQLVFQFTVRGNFKDCEQQYRNFNLVEPEIANRKIEAYEKEINSRQISLPNDKNSSIIVEMNSVPEVNSIPESHGGTMQVEQPVVSSNPVLIPQVEVKNEPEQRSFFQMQPQNFTRTKNGINIVSQLPSHVLRPNVIQLDQDESMMDVRMCQTVPSIGLAIGGSANDIPQPIEKNFSNFLDASSFIFANSYIKSLNMFIIGSSSERGQHFQRFWSIFPRMGSLRFLSVHIGPSYQISSKEAELMDRELAKVQRLERVELQFKQIEEDSLEDAFIFPQLVCGLGESNRVVKFL